MRSKCAITKKEVTDCCNNERMSVINCLKSNKDNVLVCEEVIQSFRKCATVTVSENVI